MVGIKEKFSPFPERGLVENFFLVFITELFELFWIHFLTLLLKKAFDIC